MKPTNTTPASTIQEEGYTKGNWEVEQVDKYTPSKQDFLEVSDGHKIIARILNEYAQVGTSKQEASANAKLIASAPHLKAENEQYEQYIEYCDQLIEDNIVPIHFVEWREKLQPESAIQKHKQ